MRHSFIIFLATFVFLLSAIIPRLSFAQDDRWGVYTWGSWDPKKVNRDTHPHIKGVPIILKWDKIEPRPGEFRFDEILGGQLRAARENGFYTHLMLWVVPCTPEWLYDSGVPRVDVPERVNPFRRKVKWDYPHYLDADYKKYFHRVIGEFGAYVRELPRDLKERIVFLQIAEGSTGDGQPYKGAPTDSRYAISREQWSAFRLETWGVYKKAFSEMGEPCVAFLVNNDANRDAERQWLLDNLNIIGFKQGMFSHGYHISGTRERVAQWRSFTSKAEVLGKTTFCRGEQDGEWNICGWSKKNPPQAFYWSALFALHCGLDLWNVPKDACRGEGIRDALVFFNKYAGKNDAASSPGAFCALRGGLDASDTARFPEADFGTARKSNLDRYLKIAERFAEYGAYQGDPEKALGGGMKNRQRDDYNDVGWGIERGNYGRFLEQVDPEETSVGRWHAGPRDHVYSRFARAFHRESGKTAMFFRLDKRFFPDKDGPRKISVRVVYLDRGRGAWALCYNDGEGKRKAYETRCGDTGLWVDKTVFLDGAFFNRGLAKKSDLIIESSDGGDTVFHLIELDRL